VRSVLRAHQETRLDVVSTSLKSLMMTHNVAWSPSFSLAMAMRSVFHILGNNTNSNSKSNDNVDCMSVSLQRHCGCGWVKKVDGKKLQFSNRQLQIFDRGDVDV